jgi:HEAT repeat protein
MLWSLALLFAAMAALLAITAFGRLLRIRRRIRRERLRNALRPSVVALLADPESEPQLPPVGRRTEDLFEVLSFDYLAKVRGESRDALVRALDDRGTIVAAERRVQRVGTVGRASAAELLGRCALVRSRGPLIGLLAHRSAEVRLVGVRALGRLRDPSAVAPLLAMVDAERSVPAAVVTQALVRIGPRGIEELRAAVRYGSPAERAVAAEALGLQRAVEAVPELLAGLDDEHVGVRSRAAGALGRIGDPRARDPLLRAVTVDGPLRIVAVHALGDLGDPGAVAILSGLLDDPRHEVASAAAGALARCGPSGLGALRESSEGHDQSARQAAAALAVAGLGSSRATVDPSLTAFPVA